MDPKPYIYKCILSKFDRSPFSFFLVWIAVSLGFKPALRKLHWIGPQIHGMFETNLSSTSSRSACPREKSIKKHWNVDKNIFCAPNKSALSISISNKFISKHDFQYVVIESWMKFAMYLYIDQNATTFSVRFWVLTIREKILYVVKLKLDEPWKRVFGPIFIYLNSAPDSKDPSLLWEDAKSQVQMLMNFSKLCHFVKNY